MTNEQALVKSGVDISTMEKVLAQGDLTGLTGDQRVKYYNAICESVGLNPLTRPFDYIVLKGKLTLYTKKDCTEQLRTMRKISITQCSRRIEGDLCIAEATATDATGRTDTDIGVVNIKGLSGDDLANALMKANTKAKRRVTLSICGLGFTDESELETIPDAIPISVDIPTGTIVSVGGELKQENIEDNPRYDSDSQSLVASDPEQPTPPAQGEKMSSVPQQKRIYAISKSRGLSDADIKKLLFDSYGIEHTRDLTLRQASDFMGKIESMAVNNA